eukprot:9220205-Pyramimonas_sp.AAC.1
MQPLYAYHGLPAGDGNADFAIEIHAMTEMDYFRARCPTIDSLNYIDGSAAGSSASHFETAKT